MDFDRVAQSWDDARRTQRARVIACKIEASLGQRAYRTGLEFGCGTGLIGLALAARFERLIMLDASQGMIEQLSGKLTGKALQTVHPVVFDLEREAYPARADCIFSSMAVHHVRDAQGLMARFYDMLAPGGRLCLVDLDPVSPLFHAGEDDFAGHHGFSHAEISGWAQEAGFQNVSTQTFYRGEKGIGAQTVPYSLFCLTCGKE